MSDALSIISEIGTTLFLIGIFCCFPITAVTAILGGTLAGIRQRKAGERLAPQLGLRKLNDATHPLQIWYGGHHKGREYALQTFVVASSFYFEGRRRRSLSTQLRLAVPLALDAPPGIAAARNRNNKNPPDYAAAFMGENHESLNPAAQRAMFAFSKKGEPTGFHKPGTIRFARGWRSISLFDRQGDIERLLAPEVFPHAHAVLIHDLPDPDIPPEDLRARLTDLADLASAIETGLPAPSLDPATIPPEAPWRRNAGLVFSLFLALGLPILLCLCGSILAGLGAY
jgi:hypothetical protein